ncbi:MAG: hypothetical protein PHW04_08625 [Candidatus Wallbacteria bacterium]|nr:hypothetical protein [Candidatus Wallbacteria bacterium]
MKFVVCFELLFAFICSSQTTIVFSNYYIADQHQTEISNPRFSPSFSSPIILNESAAFSSDTSETVSCLTELKSLNGLIDTSLWTLYLSKQITEQMFKESIEQIYSASLDEIDRESTSIAIKIAKSLKNDDDHPFREFTDFFHRSTENQKSGLSTLAMKIDENLRNKNLNPAPRTPNLEPFLREIKEIISEANSAQVSFAPSIITLQQMLDCYGMLIVNYQSQALNELTATKNFADYGKKRKFFIKAFDLYHILGLSLDKRNEKADTVATVMSKADKAKNEGRYSDAIGLYKQVLSVDYQYGIKHDCHQRIGECYRELNDYDNAIFYFKESIVKDSSDSTKYYSYKYGLDWHLGGNLPTTEDTYLKAVKFCQDVIGISPLQDMRNDCRYQIGAIYQNWLASLSGISDEKKELYYNKAIDAYRTFIAEYQQPVNTNYSTPAQWNARREAGYSFSQLGRISSLAKEKRISYYDQAGEEYLKAARDYPESGDSPLNYHTAAYVYQYDVQAILDNRADKDRFYLKAIAAYKELYTNYPTNAQYDYTLLDIGVCYRNMGSYYENGMMNYRREYLLLAVESCDQYLKDFPNGRYRPASAMQAATSCSDIAFSYQNEKDIANVEKYFLLSSDYWKMVVNMNEADDSSKLQSQYHLGENYKYLSDAFNSIANDKEKQRKYGLIAVDEFAKVPGYSSTLYGYRYYCAGSLRSSGDIFLGLEEYDKAISNYDQVIAGYSDITSDYQYSHLGKADSLYGKASYTEAKDWYNKIYGLNIDNFSKPYFYCRTELGLAKCELGLGNPQAAHQHLAKVVKDYNSASTWFDEYVLEAKELTLSKVLRIKIDPMVDTIAEGESKTFTATVVYPDDTQAMVPSGSIREWKWECSGNEGDNHVFDFTGNSATYKGGSGDFMDTILTAKVLIDAGGYGARAVSAEIWIEGDNQVPVSLVNEDGKRIRKAPMYIPYDGSHCGPPPAIETPVSNAIEFLTKYTDDSVDSFTLIFLGDDDTHETVLKFTETGKDSRFFQSENGLSTIEIIYPLPDIQSNTRNILPGQDKIKFKIYFSDAVMPIELPIWKGPGIGTSEIRDDLYLASNQIIDISSCGDLSPEDYSTKNTVVHVQIKDSLARTDSVKVKISSSAESERELECKKIKPGTYLSDGIVPIEWNYVNPQIKFHGKEYTVLKVNPSNNTTAGEIELKYSSGKYSINRREFSGKGALVICALQNDEMPSASSIFWDTERIFYHCTGKYHQVIEGIKEVLKTVKEMTDCNYNVTVNFVPFVSNFDNFSKNAYDLSKYAVIYFIGHSATISDVTMFYVFKDKSDVWSGIEPKGEIFPDTIKALTLFFEDEQCPKFVIMNACESALGENGGKWLEVFKSKALVGWTDTVQVPTAEVFFTSFFKIVKDGWKQQIPTSVYSACEQAGSEVPNMPYKIEGNENLLLP